jgi:hypothetical protein
MLGLALLLGAACAGGAADRDASSGDAAGTGAGPSVPRDDRLGQAEYSADGGAIAGAPAAEVAPSDPGATQSGAGVNEAPAAPGALPSILDRKIIMTATLSLETDEVSRRFEDVGNIAAQYGGFISSSSFGRDDEAQRASITIRVPVSGYQNALIALRKLGEVTGEQSNASDVTEEYTDLDSRLRSLRAVEAQYIEFLNRAATIDEILTVQDRLNATRIEIEQVQGRINLLNNQTDLATITVQLGQPVAEQAPVDDGKTTPVEALENGWEASLEVLAATAAVVLVVAAFFWWLVPLAAAVAYIARRQAKAAKARQAALPSPPATA